MQDSSILLSELADFRERIWTLAQTHQADSQALLTLLRSLELLHREICEQLFQPSLPDTRHQLYRLLREMDEAGGWPYIERLRLEDLLSKLLLMEATEASEETTDDCTD